MNLLLRRSLGLAVAALALAGCERAPEAPSSGGFENPEVVTPAEVPPSAAASDTTAAPPEPPRP